MIAALHPHALLRAPAESSFHLPERLIWTGFSATTGADDPEYAIAPGNPLPLRQAVAGLVALDMGSASPPAAAAPAPPGLPSADAGQGPPADPGVTDIALGPDAPPPAVAVELDTLAPVTASAIRIRVALADGGADIALTAAAPMLREAWASAMPQLCRAAQAAGIGVAAVVVTAGAVPRRPHERRPAQGAGAAA
jgi:hypothetical protein